LWHEWTLAAKSTFIPDEKIMHLMVARFGPSSEISVATGGRWNCSPRLQPAGLEDRDVRIWHFHGDSNLRPSNSQRGFEMWKVLYQHVMSENLGFIRDWIRSVPNKHLKKLFAENQL
jgi:hypothetical protein